MAEHTPPICLMLTEHWRYVELQFYNNMSKQNRIDTQKKGGRPKLKSYEKRRHQFNVSYNDTELEKMEVEAKKHKRTTKRWMHDAPLQSKDKIYTDEEQTDYVRKLAGMANNINQIAHQANLGGLYSLEAKCKEVLNLITTLITRIFKGGDLSKA